MARGGFRQNAGRPRADGQPKRQAIARAVIKADPPPPPKSNGAFDSRALVAIAQILELSQKSARSSVRRIEDNPFKLPHFPKSAIPRKPELRMAMDEAMTDASVAWMAGAILNGMNDEGLMFPGYTYLSNLAQRPEYRLLSETIADDATRKWIRFDVSGTEEGTEDREKEDAERQAQDFADPEGAAGRSKERVAKSGLHDKVKQLTDFLIQIEARDRFYDLARGEGFFGRMHLFLSFGKQDSIDPQTLRTPIGDGRDRISKTQVSPDNPLRRLKAMEPVWTYPMSYNAANPLLDDWYNPQVWYVMGQEVHCSRILPFVTRPVPDVLKPAYAFGGLSMSQLAEPYVNIWLRTRQSVADLVHSFSTMVLSTDLSTLMQPGTADALLARVAMFNALRDNQGTFVVNKNSEDFKNVSAPISGLDSLQAQAQEHMSSVSRIPLVKLTGISPKGLNASSEGEIRVYYDTIGAYQNRSLRPPLTKVINFAQLSLWGEIDPRITFEFEPLWDMSPKEQADLEKAQAERDEKYVNLGALDPAEVRERIINDPKLPYADLDPDDVPEPPDPMGGMEGGGEPDMGGGPGGAQPAKPAAKEPGGEDNALDPFGGAIDAAHWSEEEHPRAPDGKFGAGSGGSSSGKPRKTSQRLIAPQYGLSPTPRYEQPRPVSQGDPAKPTSVVMFTPGENAIPALNGKKFESWLPPEDWSDVEGQADIDEPDFPDTEKEPASGVIIREPDGRTWLLRPKGGFGGYDQTFPKGRVDEGLSLQANAIKEAFEETGLKVRITGFAGDHEGDLTMTRYYTAERETGDPADAGEESDGVLLSPVAKLKDYLNRDRDRKIAKGLGSDAAFFLALDEFTEGDHPRAPDGKFTSGGGGGGAASTSGGSKSGSGTVATKPLSPLKLEKTGPKMGSNDGGTFKDKETGKEYYIKKPQSKAHVINELLGAKLYQLAGGNTLNYVPVEGGAHVATELAKLDVDNVNKFTPAEKKQAQKDFITQAWLGNWDAAGTGGDNKGILNGKPTALDFGGALEYRAQGEPKGDQFGSEVPEIDTFLDSEVSPDNAKLYGTITPYDQRQSAKQVTDLTNDEIITAVKEAGGTATLAQKLIDRKSYIAAEFNLTTDQSAWDDAKHPRNPDGTFAKGMGGEPAPSSQPAKTDNDDEVIKPGAYGGLYVVKSDDPITNHFLTVDKVLENKSQIGIHYRRMLARLIKDSPKMGAGEGTVGKLKQKLTESLEQSLSKAMSAGKADEVKKLAVALAKLNGGAAPAMPAPAPKPAPAPAPAPAKAAAPKAEPAPAPKPAPSTFPAPTPAELQKATKSIALQKQYVPGASEVETPKAQAEVDKRIAAFNAKYAGKELGGNQPALIQKVNDFKQLVADVEAIAKAESPEKAKLLEQKKQEQAKQLAEQQKKQAEQHAAEAAEQATLMKDPDYAALKGIGAAGSAYLQSGKSTAAVLAKKGINVTPLQGALLRTYIGSHYDTVNEQLYEGALSPAQFKYRMALDKAFRQMPVYEGKVIRGIKHIDAKTFAKYKPGHVVPSPAFMSAGKVDKLWGNFTLEIHGKTARDISMLNGEGGGEVVFLPHTHFEVVSNNGKHAVLKEV